MLAEDGASRLPLWSRAIFVILLPMNTQGLRTWIEIDTKALKHNYDTFRKMISSETKLCVVAKSNAYGHGLTDYSKEMQSLGVDMIAVDSVVEAMRLRKEGITIPILILGYTLSDRVIEAVLNDIALSISTFELLQYVVDTAFKKIPRVHIKVDTGMGRQGFLPSNKEKVISLLKKHRDDIIVEGLYTHFASSKNPAFPADTQKQIAEFQQWIDVFAEYDIHPLKHAAATSGTLLFPESHFDMVRIGIGMYGEWPSLETKLAREETYPLKRALTWKTIISEIKKLPEGSRVGYDGTEILERDSIVAICPVGYWHGFRRALSSIGYVMVGGQKVRVLGRVSMDMIEIDVTDGMDVKVGSEVELINDEISLSYVASLVNSSNYEILTTLNPLIKKFYL